MRKGILALGLFALVCIPAVAGAADPEFDSALKHYFDVSDEQFDAVQEHGLAPEDLAVCFHIARYSKSNPVTLAKVRARGDSWRDIVLGRNGSMDIFYKPIVGYAASEVYYPILAKFDNTPTDQWRKLELTDDEVVKLVNLRFIASEHDYSIYEVMAQVDEGKSFADINRNIKAAKEVLVAEQEQQRRETLKAGL